MKPPIIADNKGDVLVFRSPREAELYIEPVDAQNQEYVAYDSEGRLLRLLAIKRNKVALELMENEPSHASQLRKLLQKHLVTLGVPFEWADEASLTDLVAKRLEYKTD